MRERRLYQVACKTVSSDMTREFRSGEMNCEPLLRIRFHLTLNPFRKLSESPAYVISIKWFDETITHKRCMSRVFSSALCRWLCQTLAVAVKTTSFEWNRTHFQLSASQKDRSMWILSNSTMYTTRPTVIFSHIFRVLRTLSIFRSVNVGLAHS